MPAKNEVTIKLTGDTTGLTKALSGAKGQLQKLGKDLAVIAAGATAAFAGLTAVIAKSVATFRVQEQAEFRLNAVLKSTKSAAGLTAKEIKNMASELQSVTTFGDEAIISSSNLLLTFKQIGGDIFPRAQKAILDVSTAMGTSLKDSAIQIGKALNDPIYGLTALRRVGITFTKGQEEMIKSMTKAGDVASAQAVILEELESQFGGAAEAAAQGTGSFVQLRNVFGDFVEKIGEQFVPVLAEGARALTAFFQKINENKQLFIELAKALAIGAAVSGAIAALTGFGLAILAAASVVSVLVSAVAGLVTFALSPLGLILAALGVAVAVFIANWDLIKPSIDKIIQSFAMFDIKFGESINWIELGGKIVAGAFGLLSGLVVESIRQMALAIEGLALIWRGWADRSITGVLEGVAQIGTVFTAGVGQIAITAGTTMKEKFEEGFAITEGVKGFGDLADRTKKFFGEQIKRAEGFAEKRLGIDINMFSELRQLFGGFRNAREDESDKLHTSLVGMEADFAAQMAAIDQTLGNEQVAIAKDTSKRLIDEASARQAAIASAESGGGGGGYGGVDEKDIVVGEGHPLRDVFDNPEMYDFTVKGFRKRLFPRVDPSSILGSQGFQHGFSGNFRDRIPARIAPGEIVVPETFAEGIRRGRYALVGSGQKGMGQPGMNRREKIDVNIGFSSVEASKVLTAQTNADRSLRTHREAIRFLS